MDIDKIKNEFAKIKGRKIQYNDSLVYIEDLLPAGEGVEPIVLLSDDSQISIMEAVNLVENSPAPSIQNNGGGGGDQRSFFPEIQYDPDGIPIISALAQSEVEMEEVAARVGTKTSVPTSPVEILVSTAKKQPKSIQVTFDVEVVNGDLFNVLKSSYEEEEVIRVLSADITRQIKEQAEERVKENLNSILTT